MILSKYKKLLNLYWKVAGIKLKSKVVFCSLFRHKHQGFLYWAITPKKRKLTYLCSCMKHGEARSVPVPKKYKNDSAFKIGTVFRKED